jgi:hypothetical protein
LKLFVSGRQEIEVILKELWIQRAAQDSSNEVADYRKCVVLKNKCSGVSHNSICTKIEAANSPETTLATHYLHYVTFNTTRPLVTIHAARASDFTLSRQYESIPQYNVENSKLLDELV